MRGRPTGQRYRRQVLSSVDMGDHLISDDSAQLPGVTFPTADFFGLPEGDRGGWNLPGRTSCHQRPPPTALQLSFRGRCQHTGVHGGFVCDHDAATRRPIPRPRHP